MSEDRTTLDDSEIEIDIVGDQPDLVDLNCRRPGFLFYQCTRHFYPSRHRDVGEIEDRFTGRIIGYDRGIGQGATDRIGRIGYRASLHDANLVQLYAGRNIGAIRIDKIILPGMEGNIQKR